MSGLPVLITRAEPAASRTARKLQSLGYTPLVLPIFECVDTQNPLPDKPYSHYIFTSANALEVLGRRGWKPHDGKATTWCVGSKTADAAKRVGFSNIKQAPGNAKGLASLIKKDIQCGEKSELLYPAATNRSFDMAGALNNSGLKVDYVEIYSNQKVFPPREIFENFIEKVENGVIFLYSSRSSEHFSELINKYEPKIRFATIDIVAISESAAKMVLKYPWRGVYASRQADEESMILQLGQI